MCVDDRSDLRVRSFGSWTLALVGVGVTSALLAATPTHAIDGCRAKTHAKDGTIEVSATKIVGSVRWGPTAQEQELSFENESECVDGPRAKRCRLGARSSQAGITPPELCSLHLRDDASTCTIYLKGCTPGRRVEEGAAPPPKPTDWRQAPVVSIVDGVSSSHTRSLRKYVARAAFDPTYAAFNTASRVVSLPQQVLVDYCADEEGCEVSLSMTKGIDHPGAQSLGPLKWYYQPSSGRFRSAVSGVSGEFHVYGEGADANGAFDHSLKVANCYLTDADYTLGTNNAIDDSAGFYLLNHISNPAYRGDCELSIVD